MIPQRRSSICGGSSPNYVFLNWAEDSEVMIPLTTELQLQASRSPIVPCGGWRVGQVVFCLDQWRWRVGVFVGQCPCKLAASLSVCSINSWSHCPSFQGVERQLQPTCAKFNKLIGRETRYSTILWNFCFYRTEGSELEIGSIRACKVLATKANWSKHYTENKLHVHVPFGSILNGHISNLFLWVNFDYISFCQAMQLTDTRQVANSMLSNCMNHNDWQINNRNKLLCKYKFAQ